MARHIRYIEPLASDPKDSGCTAEAKQGDTDPCSNQKAQSKIENKMRIFKWR